jgi:hypothetical protein
MQMSILRSGEREALKGTVHGIALGLAAFIGTYNVSAWLQRRERHLAVNTIVYAALVLFELRHVRHHWASAASARSTALLLAAAASATVDADEAMEKKAA